ncbi:MAG: trigger factor [Planctomycetes bacterium]|nr:trigger factor [Planctomycetota bacterium]
MEVQVAETGPCSRSLQIKITPEQVTEHLDQVYASASQQVQVKGFRPGKVPRKMIEKMHGPAILQEAKEQLLNRYFGEACREHEIQPVGRVKIDDFEQLELKQGEGLEFTAKVDVKPEFEIPDAKGIEIPAFEEEANDEDIDNALKEIAHQKRTIQKVDEPVEDGDFVKCDYTFVDADGNDVHTKTGVQLNTRIPINGVDAKAYSEALISGKAGEEREMPITFPANFEKEAVRGKEGKVKVRLHEVMRVAPPPIDDELAKGMEFESLEQMRDDLRARISQEKVRIGKQRQEEAALDHLAKAADITLPPSLVEEQEQASLGAYAQRLQQEGMSDDEIQKKLEESKAEAHEDAERRVRMFFLIEAVAQQQNLTVEESDMRMELEAIAQANSGPEQQITAAQVHQHLQEQNRLGELQLSLLERKVREFLRENGQVVDKTGS